MRLKSYTAPSMAEAMSMVRRELGEDAIIVSTQRASGGQGVRITAALEEATTDEEIQTFLTGAAPSPIADTVREALAYHGVPARLTEKLVTAAREVGSEDPVMACAGALDSCFGFAGLPDRKAPRPFVLVGTPGSGKSITVAKLAARARIQGRQVGVITADSVRAGALEQLSAFTRILEVDLRKVRGPDSLATAIADVMPFLDLVFVDTPGLNPFTPSDMDYLAELTEAANGETVMVMAAGGDPIEAAEMAEAFASIGATRLVSTRLDMTRRLGAVLSAAEAGQFIFGEVSITPHVANGLCNINPVSMARLIVPQEILAQTIPSNAPRETAVLEDDDEEEDEDSGDMPPMEAEARPRFSLSTPDPQPEDPSPPPRRPRPSAPAAPPAAGKAPRPTRPAPRS